MQRVREQVQVPEQLHSGAGRVKSVTVAVLDTGIAYHPDLVGRLLAFSDFVEGRSFPYDDNGHGTHVCGIVCGRESPSRTPSARTAWNSKRIILSWAVSMAGYCF